MHRRPRGQGLYRRPGWVHVGIIPGFALDTDGKTLHDDSLYHLKLHTTVESGDC